MEKELFFVARYHEDNEVRIAAGLELVDIYMKEKKFNKLLEIAEDSKMPEIVREDAGIKIVEMHTNKGNARELEELERNSWLPEKVVSAVKKGIKKTGLSEVKRLAKKKDEKKLLWIAKDSNEPEEVGYAAGKALLAIYSERDDLLSMVEISEDERFDDRVRLDAGMTLIEGYVARGNFDALKRITNNDEDFPVDVKARAREELRKYTKKLAENPGDVREMRRKYDEMKTRTTFAGNKGKRKAPRKMRKPL